MRRFAPLAPLLLLVPVLVHAAPGGSLSSPGTAGASCGIFVAKSGANTPTCGLVPGSPCLTVQQGLDRAVIEGASCVFVQAGTYTQTILLKPGVSVIGGFDANWVSGPYTQAGHVTQIIGVANQVDSQSMVVAARNLTPAVLLENLVLTAPNASGLMASTTSGKSSYVIHATGSNLVVRSCKLDAGDGVNGGPGTNGANAIALARVAAMNGGAGGNGDQFVTTCNDASRGAGGPHGVNGQCTLADGGNGGAGGHMDTDCTGANQLPATSGIAGTDATTTLALFGTKGAGGSPCTNGITGNLGRVFNGSAGARGSGGVAVAISNVQYFIGAAGAVGGLGGSGGGGGGGGGEGGCDTGIDSYGAGGGGGGAGGCPAIGGGTGGGAGGGSIGIALFASHLDVSGCEFVMGHPGIGGPGGTGGQGQQGGLAGAAGTGTDSRTGGRGGAGAHGGHAGGGGGGSGGVCIGVARCNNSTSTISTSTFATFFTALGGAGGVSAPGVAAADDDGNDGQTGMTGLTGQNLSVATCATGPVENLAVTPCDIVNCLLVDASPVGGSTPLAFAGLAPNPTRAGGRFDFTLPRAGRVRLALYDSAGRRRRTLVDAPLSAGAQAAPWDGSDDAGGKLASGIYLARLEFEGEQRVERVIVIH